MVVVGGNGFGGQRREEDGGRDDKEMEKKIEKVERVRIYIYIYINKIKKGIKKYYSNEVVKEIEHLILVAL